MPAKQTNETSEAPRVTDWQGVLIRGKNGIVPILANAIIALRSSEAWAGVLAFDEFSMSAVMRSKPPWAGKPGPITDHEERLCANWLQHNGILIGPEVAGQAMQVCAKDRIIHPVREYLCGLEWDGRERIDDWLNFLLGVTPTDFSTAIGPRFLISGVARIMNPGAKVDTCLILEGKQGSLKSTALKCLGGQWFTDEIADLGSKDAAMQTRGVWLIEIAELDGLTRAEVGRIKAFMSRTVDRFRPPYGRHLVESPRQCIFAGSVNHQAYLRDDSGGRRFWPVECGRIRIDDLARDRDQLWAEAVTRYRRGASWWLETATLTAAAEDEQGDRFEGTVWDGLIHPWLDERLAMGFDITSTEEILELCLKKQPGQWTRADQMMVGSSLRSVKWQRIKVAGKWRWRPEVEVARVAKGVAMQ